MSEIDVKVGVDGVEHEFVEKDAEAPEAAPETKPEEAPAAPEEAAPETPTAE